MFPVYPLLTTSTVYWIITNASTTDTTWPPYSLLRYLLLFPTNHNLGFIGRPYYRSSLWYSMSSVVCLSVCRLSVCDVLYCGKNCLKEWIGNLCYNNNGISGYFHKFKLHIIYMNLLPNSVFEDPFHHFHTMLKQFNSSVRSTLQCIPFPFVITHLTSSPLQCNFLSKYRYINPISTEFQYPLCHVSFLLLALTSLFQSWSNFIDPEAVCWSS